MSLGKAVSKGEDCNSGRIICNKMRLIMLDFIKMEQYNIFRDELLCPGTQSAVQRTDKVHRLSGKGL